MSEEAVMAYLEDVVMPAESIADGTWASGEPPEEWSDWWLMREMRWSWEELQATPAYVRRYCADLTQAWIKGQNTRAERAEREANRG